MMKSGMLMFQGRIDLCSCFKRFYSVSCRYTSVCIRSRNQLNVVNICFHLICSFLLRFVTTYAMHHWRRKELICPCVFKMFIEQMLRNHSFVNVSNLFSLSIRLYFVLSLCCSHLMLLSWNMFNKHYIIFMSFFNDCPTKPFFTKSIVTGPLHRTVFCSIRTNFTIRNLLLFVVVTR